MWGNLGWRQARENVRKLRWDLVCTWLLVKNKLRNFILLCYSPWKGIFFLLCQVVLQSLRCFISFTLVTLSSQHKQRNLVWTKGTDALEGELQSSSEVDFYIDQVKHHCKCRYLSQPVHTTPEELENAALFLRLGLPSTGILFRHDIGAFRKPEQFEFEFYCFK